MPLTSRRPKAFKSRESESTSEAVELPRQRHFYFKKRRSDPTPGARLRAKVEGRETEGGADGR